MSTSSTIFRRALIFAVAALLLVPAAGFAHALFGDNNPNRPVLEYIWIGFLHMVGGWDHQLVVLGVVLIARALKPAAKLISLFVLGHSLTLIPATVAGWKVPYAIAAPDPEQAEPLRVIAALRTMTCRKPDMTALASFYDAWMLEVQGRQG
jgi:hydrogenase/urease accessory protein HupE